MVGRGGGAKFEYLIMVNIWPRLGSSNGDVRVAGVAPLNVKV